MAQYLSHVMKELGYLIEEDKDIKEALKTLVRRYVSYEKRTKVLVGLEALRDEHRQEVFLEQILKEVA